jgi:hypothetical protein
MKPSCLKCLLAALLLAKAATTHAQLVNGNFATGDLTGWTLYDTQGIGPIGFPSYGGTALAGVVQFDTAGTGMPANSAQFMVGEVAGGEVGGGGLGQGIGFYQYVPLSAGVLSISANIASQCSSEDGDYGTFLLLINGNVVDSVAFGGVSEGTTLRSTLDFAQTITGGTDQVGIEIRRGGGFEYPDSPFEYVSDIQLSVTPVPEPSTTALCVTALLVGLLVRHAVRKSDAARN